jgi:hypothetical protein
MAALGVSPSLVNAAAAHLRTLGYHQGGDWCSGLCISWSVMRMGTARHLSVLTQERVMETAFSAARCSPGVLWQRLRLVHTNKGEKHMINIYRPDLAQIARLIKTDKLIRYEVEELGGQIIAIRNLREPHGTGYYQ